METTGIYTIITDVTTLTERSQSDIKGERRGGRGGVM